MTVKYKREIKGTFPCFKCGKPAEITKSSQDGEYCYSIHCPSGIFGHGACFTQKHFDAMKKHKDFIPA